MKYQFSWITNEKLETFTTSCPRIGEDMMRSSVDFPKRSPEIQKVFDDIYGPTRGKFEQVLREGESTHILGEIQTGIKGLTVRLLKEEMGAC